MRFLFGRIKRFFSSASTPANDPLAGLEVQYIHENGNTELFRQSYDKLFATTWPEFVDLDTPEEMLKSDDTNLKKFIMVVGRNLADTDPEKREIIGFRYAFYYPQSQTAMLVYLAVDPQYRNRGIGRRMVDLTNEGLHKFARSQKQSLKGVFFEIDNPAMTTNESGGLAPQKRKALFERWGARQVPITYIRPDYKPDGSWDMGGGTYLLMAYPLNGSFPNHIHILGALADTHVYLTGHSRTDVLKSNSVRSMIRMLQNTPAYWWLRTSTPNTHQPEARIAA